MKSWIFWVGISFILGGSVSLALNLAVEGPLTIAEDLTGYAVGWLAVGVIFIMYSLVKNKKESKS